MQYDDEIYGRVTIEEPILIDLMHSQAMQRLRGVLQHGITGLIGLTDPITRYDHSVGAMLLVRRLGGSRQEQMAALLHDVSHTVFSHVIDHVFGSPVDQSYHDEVKETYVAQTDIPAIMNRHGYDWRDFIEESHFPLLEQPSPALCADRIDYFVRDCIGLGIATAAQVADALAQLTVHDNRIVCTDIGAARWFGDTFMAADDASWSNFREVGLYEMAAQAIRRGFAIGTISDDDIWGQDVAVWEKLRASADPQLQSLINQVSPATRFIWDADQPHFRVTTKIRTIDPDVLIGTNLQPLSQLAPDYAQARQAYLNRKQGSWPIRVLPATAT